MKKNGNKQKRKKIEFSKIVMASILFTYFVSVVFGIICICKLFASPDPMTASAITSALGYFFTFTGASVSVAVGFYSNKAKTENVIKIKHGFTNCNNYNDYNYLQDNTNYVEDRKDEDYDE